MSTEITSAFVEHYAHTMLALSQQRGSKLRGAVRTEQVRGHSALIDRIGAVAAIRRIARHADTPQMDTPHSRRRVSLVDYDWADLIDDSDKLRMIVDPVSPYAQAGAWAMGRAMDDEIIAAFTATAHAGPDGASPVDLPDGQKVAAGGTGLTLGKLLEAKEILDAHDVDEQIPRHLALSSKQVSDLLNTTEVKSSDYNTVKALAQGELDSFLGFRFIRTERLLHNSDDTRRVIAWAEDGMVLAIGQQPVARIDERPDKNYATQVFYSMTIGATRLEEEKVVSIACVES